MTGQTALANLTTVTANVITNSSGSNTVCKINDLILTNYSSSAASANVVINRSSTTYYIGGNVSVPSYSTLVLIGKDSAFYLLEGDVIQANVSSNLAIHLVSSYEIIS